MLEFLLSLHWGAIAQIIMIDILLGGDNAIVIALACRNLPQHQRNRAIWWGTAGAILLRVALVSVAVILLDVPFLKLAGGLLLLWIGLKLIAPGADDDPQVASNHRLFAAIKTIVIADAVMSIDNVVAVAGAAGMADGAQRFALIVFGLVISIPIIVWGSRVVLTLFDRLPWLVTLGAALLGWIAGGLIVGDSMVARWLEPGRFAAPLAGLTGAALVVAVGWLLRRRNTACERRTPE
ncbi:TerC family protein [Burkholderia pyrrocinia]|uniref:TerC family protein n=1 Tax=Burkholderia pyrrocinia TaxID=60550 RepID=UPI00105095A2|nr:TerC family protein [Burkholderia pyrrocinia]TDA47461.1 TerC family protein [Burkholderia pyrrocinia]